MPLVDRPDQRPAGVHRRPPRGRPHHLPGLVVLGRLVRPRSPPAPRRGRQLPRAGAGPRSRSSWDQLNHRPPTPTRGRITAVDKRFRTPGCGRKVASSAGCGGFETVAARPPQPPGGRTRPQRDRSQPTGGNPIASPPLALGLPHSTRAPGPDRLRTSRVAPCLTSRPPSPSSVGGSSRGCWRSRPRRSGSRCGCWPRRTVCRRRRSSPTRSSATTETSRCCGRSPAGHRSSPSTTSTCRPSTCTRWPKPASPCGRARRRSSTPRTRP